MPHLEVKVGSDLEHMEACRVNDTRRPHEIDTEHFVGRVVVRILDAPGAREGEEGREYFTDRSRKFCIQIEGRFKHRWNGDDIHFGSDFDRFVEFPRAPFNAGMRVARYIDPCTFYEESPPSGRPYIMSPYCACMNILCAWPAPSRAHDAVVVLRHVQRGSSSGLETPVARPGTPADARAEKNGDNRSGLVEEEGDETEDVVPREALSRSTSVRRQGSMDGNNTNGAKATKKKGWLSGVGHVLGGGLATAKEERVVKKYWRFVGFKDEPQVRALLEAHNAKLEHRRQLLPDEVHQPVRSDSALSTESGTHIGDVQHGIASDHPTLRRLGTNIRNKLPNFHLGDPGTPPQAAIEGAPSSEEISPLEEEDGAGHDYFVTAPETAGQRITEVPVERSASPIALGGEHPSAASSDHRNPASAVEMPPLQRITTRIRSEAQRAAASDGLNGDDFRLADDLRRKTRLNSEDTGSWHSKLDDQLGPWRFSEPGTDMIEDNAFVFSTHSLSVPKRRKYFASVENRKKFEYDPDVVYGASFFSDAFDFNTLSLSLGPVKLGLTKFFGPGGMPIRYTLRHKDEKPTFVTISFQLVD